MVEENWLENLQESLTNMGVAVLDFLPTLIMAILIVIVGWIIGAVLGKVVEHLIRMLKVDESLKRAGVEEMLHRGGLSLNSGYFLGVIVKWFIIIAFLIPAFDLLTLNEVNVFLLDILGYVPNIIVAVIILIVAAVVGDVLKKLVSASASSARLRSANLLGNITKWAVWIFAILSALTQLNVAEDMIRILFMGIVVAISLAVGLSFGLGGQETAARILERTRDEISHKE